MARSISTSADAMNRLINDLLDFAGAELGAAIPIKTAPVDLGALCQEVLAEMRAAYPMQTIRLSHFGDTAGEWDPARLRQVISNLLGNAIQHGAPAPANHVDVDVSGDGSDVVLSVRNWGTPIPQEALATIFEPMVHVPSSQEEHQPPPRHFGLGLYITRALVSAHGGSVDVQSTRETGTVFTIHLPRRPPQ